MFTEVGGDVVAFDVEIGAYRHLPRPIVLTDALHAPDLSAKNERGYITKQTNSLVYNEVDEG